MPRLPLASVLVLGLAPSLAGCGGESADAPGGVSPGEAQRLEEAAAMLDERQLPPEAVTTQAPTSAPARP